MEHIVLFVLIHAFLTYLVHHQGRSFYVRRSDKCASPKVYDVGHMVLPDLHGSRMAHAMIEMMTLLPFVLAYAWNLDGFYRLFAIVVAIRWITTLVTILPKHKHCDDTAMGWFHFMHGHCYDKVFSGHFAASLLMAVMLYRSGNRVPAWALVAYQMIHALLILSVRNHYTIDLFVSIFVVMSVLAM